MTLTVTRINGSKTLINTVYNNNCNLYKIIVQDATPTVVNLQNETSDLKINGAIEAIVDEINPLAYYVPNATAGIIHVVMDKSINDYAELQLRIQRLGTLKTTIISSGATENVTISGTTVTLATSFVVA